MLSYLLDENISDEVAVQVSSKRSDITVYSIFHWESGRLVGARDDRLLEETAAAGLPLVTYDLNTIPSLLVQLAELGRKHGGVVFISQKTIRSNDFGGIALSLIEHWDSHRNLDWTNRVGYLRNRAVRKN